MSYTKLEFTKDWNNPADFPTIETSEAQVRADIQLLFDECKAAINGLSDDVETASSGWDGVETKLEGIESVVTTLGNTDDTLPTSKAVRDALMSSAASSIIATYDVTSFADVLAAYQAGKMIFALDSDTDTAVYTLANASPSTTPTVFVFTRVYHPEGGAQTLYVLTLTSSGWTSSASAIANTDSPALTGTPTAPTAAAGTNTTQIATTAFAQEAKRNLAMSHAAENITTVEGLKTQLAAWFATMANMSVAYFSLTISTEFACFKTGDYFVKLQRNSNTYGRADLSTDFGSTGNKERQKFEQAEGTLCYSNGEWLNPVVLTNNLGLYAYRPTDAGVGMHAYDGSLNHYLATSRMVTDKPSEDGHILTLNWDNSTMNAVQLFLPNLYGTSYAVSGKRPQIRGYRSNDNQWGPWESLALLSDVQ